MKNNKTDEFVHKTMQSLDGIQKAEPKPFLLTRIMAAIQERKNEKHGWNYRFASVLSRPVFAAAGLVFLIGINVAIVVLHDRDSKPVTGEQTASDTRDEYAYSIANIYDVENQEP